jgi:hypothetical protein
MKRPYEWMYLLIAVPLIASTLPAKFFLLMQSIFYLYVSLDDPLHHLIASGYLASCAMFPIADNELTVCVTCIAEILIGAILCPYISKKISVPCLAICRVFVHPCLIWYYVHDPLSLVLHLFFFGIALYHTVTQVVQKLRYGPYLLIKLRGLWHGINTMYIDDVQTAKSVLQTYSIKGCFIEQIVSLKAWHPVRSLESIDGQEWKELRSKFEQFMISLPSIDIMRDICIKECDAMILDKDNSDSLFCSSDVAYLVTRIMLVYVAPSSSNNVNDQLIQIILNASQEWRKEIALKGVGDRQIKATAIKLLASYLSMHETEIDHIIQPFFISPIINISDVMSALKYEPNRSSEYMMSNAIMRQHPFPFLERYVDDSRFPGIPSGTQVFIPLANMARNHRELLWMCFSVGPRRCPGQHIARVIMDVLISKLAHKTNFCPQNGHQYSGRRNDKSSEPFWYIFTVMLRSIFAPYIVPIHT